MPEREETIAAALTGRFEFMHGQLHIPRARRIFAEVPRDALAEALRFIKDDLGFSALCMITGLDTIEGFELIYHVAHPDGTVLNLKVDAPKTDAVFDTIVDIFHNSSLYEIEIHNLLGIEIRGIPEGIRYPLPDGWPEGEYPLRKDWKQPDIDIKGEGEC